jgi:hypothetical protein
VIFDDQEDEQMIVSSCRRRPLWVPLFLTLAFTAACSFNRSTAPSGNNASSTGNTAFTPSNDARKDLRDALERLNTAFPYRLTENTSGTGTGSEASGGTRVVEFAAADRSHAKLTNGPLGDSEVITIGDQRYTRVNNGNWTVGSPPGLAQRQAMEKRMREVMATAVKDVQYVGTETINGVPCHAYTYTMEMDVSGQKWAGTGKAWIGSSDGLPHQMDSDMTVSSYKRKSHVAYEYNVDFKVEKPVM